MTCSGTSRSSIICPEFPAVPCPGRIAGVAGSSGLSDHRVGGWNPFLCQFRPNRVARLNPDQRVSGQSASPGASHVAPVVPLPCQFPGDPAEPADWCDSPGVSHRCRTGRNAPAARAGSRPAESRGLVREVSPGTDPGASGPPAASFSFMVSQRAFFGILSTG